MWIMLVRSDEVPVMKLMLVMMEMKLMLMMMVEMKLMLMTMMEMKLMLMMMEMKLTSAALAAAISGEP